MKARPLVASFAVAATLAVPGLARAEKEACISAYEQTQTLRKDGKLTAAKAQAAVCARPACPALLAKDCTRWLAELEDSTPSVVLEARTSSGAEVVDVRVLVDGVLLVPRIDGKAVHVDPGAHTFRFEPLGEKAGAPVERMIVVREGEKNRRVSAAIRSDASPSRPVPLGVWVFGGASLVAFGAATFFTLDGLSRKSDLDACRPRCSAEDVDAMSARFTLADFALGAGVAAGAAAVYLFLTRPSGQPAAELRSARAPQLYVVPTGDGTGAAAGVGARF